MVKEVSIKDKGSLNAYLHRSNLLQEDQSVTSISEIRNENKWLKIRARFESGSFIVKKIVPGFEAPDELRESADSAAHFYQLAKGIPELDARILEQIYYDKDKNIMVLEDPGKARDFKRCYQKPFDVSVETAYLLVSFLKNLHSKTIDSEQVQNSAIRQLNYKKIFELPFDHEKDLRLNKIQKGLRALAYKSIFSDDQLANNARALGSIYLDNAGQALIHGKFYPGSWLNTKHGVKIIDHNFCFSGPPEFDLGTFMAHLHFCGWKQEEINHCIKAYGDFDTNLARGFMAVEILHRLFGNAQLPLDHTIAEKKKLAEMACKDLSGTLIRKI